MNEYQLDCQGLSCPEPVIRCRRVLGELRPQALHVTVDNAAANENVTRFLERNGYRATSHKEGGLWHVHGECQNGIESPQTDCQPCRVTEKTLKGETPSKTLVLITTETLGRGSDELGARLMENFLSTLPELGDELWRVILLNGGVKLAAQSGRALDSLKALEASGVDVLVCGACLTFYNLLEAKAVGETTNMLDVVTSLALADKVLRP